jgi:hypothetical protein
MMTVTAAPCLHRQHFLLMYFEQLLLRAGTLSMNIFESDPKQ